MKRTPATLAALPVVAAFCVSVSVAATAASASRPATWVRTISPVDGSGHLKAGYTVTRRLGRGTCQTGSFMTGRADRCTTPSSRSVVLDPCWPTSTRDTFVCQRKPWKHSVVQLHAPGPAAGGPGRHRPSLPWGMRIGQQTRCLLDPGSVRRLAGHRLLFHCTHHRDVFGPLRHGGTRWKAHLYRAHAHTPSGYRSLGWRPVRVAWYGAAPAPATPSPIPTLIPTLSPTASVTPTETASPSASR